MYRADPACIDQQIYEFPDPSTLPWQPESPFGIYRPNQVLHGFDGVEGPEMTVFSLKIGDQCVEIPEGINSSEYPGVPCGIKTFGPPADWQGVPPEPYTLMFDRLIGVP